MAARAGKDSETSNQHGLCQGQIRPAASVNYLRNSANRPAGVRED